MTRMMRVTDWVSASAAPAAAAAAARAFSRLLCAIRSRRHALLHASPPQRAEPAAFCDPCGGFCPNPHGGPQALGVVSSLYLLVGVAGYAQWQVRSPSHSPSSPSSSPPCSCPSTRSAAHKPRRGAACTGGIGTAFGLGQGRMPGRKRHRTRVRSRRAGPHVRRPPAQPRRHRPGRQRAGGVRAGAQGLLRPVRARLHPAHDPAILRSAALAAVGGRVFLRRRRRRDRQA